MELFRHRHLALGCGSFLVALLLSYYFSTSYRVVTLVLSAVATLVLVLIYFIFKKNLFLKALIVLVPVFLFIALAMAVSLVSFDKKEVDKYCNGQLHSVEATVTKVKTATDKLCICEIKTDKIGNENINEKLTMIYYGEALSRGDIILANGTFEELESDPLGFDEKGYNLSLGIEFSFTSFDCTVKDSKPTPILDLFENINRFLDSRIKTVNDASTYGLMSALFLGNKDNLENTVKRDFTRLGLSHALALSGMHITIIISMLSFALLPLKIKPLYKEIILLIATVFFVGITGFSPSAVRAGVMVGLTYALSFVGNRANIITSLFISVFLICLFNPYSIFSLSLILSFFALLGCVVIMKFAHSVGILRKIKFKFLRYIIITFFTSVFALLFTLPIVYLVFGNVAILSPLTNIFICPIFTVLIYLTPAYIICSFIPGVGLVFGWICRQISFLLIFIGNKCASVDGILVSIINKVQIAAVILIILFSLTFLLLNKKSAIVSLGGILISICVFAVGTVMLNHDRNNSVYVGVANAGKCDYVILEDCGEFTLFDMTANYSSPLSYAYNVSTLVGYYEIDNYVITNYFDTVYSSFNSLSGNLIVKKVTLPQPKNAGERKTSERIEKLAKERNITVSYLEKEFSTISSRVSIIPSTDVIGSRIDTFAVCIENCENAFTYLGSNTYYTNCRFAEEKAYKSDVLVFGAYGPDYKTEYSYEAPYLDYCIFFGESKKYTYSESYKDKVIKSDGTPIRFKLSP